MTNIQLKLIIGPGGSRIDFIAGWLGTLPNFIDNWWSIHPITGMSSGMFHTKMLDRGIDLDVILKEQNLSLDQTSDLYWASSCHGYKFTTDQLDLLSNHKSVKLYYIDVLNSDLSTIQWEFIVKTYFTKRNTTFFLNTRREWLIDETINLPLDQITDGDRIEAAKKIMSTYYPSSDDQFLLNSKVIKLDYRQLFQPGGSYYLCDTLNVIAHARQHEYWNHMLKFVASPPKVNVWGETWRKSDYFN